MIIGEFLTQFFITPYAGPFIIAAILTSIGLTMREIILQINPNKELFLLYLLPVLFLQRQEAKENGLPFMEKGEMNDGKN